MSNKTKRHALSIRLTSKAIQLLDALSEWQGVTRTATLELMIRKAAIEVEDTVPAVYELLHSDGSE